MVDSEETHGGRVLWFPALSRQVSTTPPIATHLFLTLSFLCVLGKLFLPLPNPFFLFSLAFFVVFDPCDVLFPIDILILLRLVQEGSLRGRLQEFIALWL